MLIDDESTIAEGYTTRTGVAVDPSSVKLYRLWWDLCEISLYTTELRATHADTEDGEIAWDGLREYLDPQRWRTACGEMLVHTDAAAPTWGCRIHRVLLGRP